MLRIGVTGTREGFRKKQEESFKFLLDTLTGSDSTIELEFHHGDCVGVDVEAAQIVSELFPNAKIICHPPIKDGWRGWFKHNTESRKEKNYLARDRDIVDDTDILIGCPRTPTPSKSGTWYTIKYGKQQKTDERRVFVITPEGKII